MDTQITPKQLKTWLLKSIPLKKSTLVTGPPGVGKSEIIEQAAAEINANFMVVHASTSDPTYPGGLPWVVKQENGEVVANKVPFSDLYQMITADKLLVVAIDDLGQASPMVQASWMQLLWARRINGHKISDNVVFIAATNRKSDRAGVTQFIEPVKSRFTTIVQLRTDADDLIEYMLQKGKHPSVTSFLRYRPAYLDNSEFSKSELRDMEREAHNNITNLPSPRTIWNLSDLVEMSPPADMEFQLYAGAVGERMAAEFYPHLKTYRSLPSLQTIFNDPDNATVPTEPSAVWATCGALAYRADTDNFKNIMHYAKRLDRAYEVKLFIDCCNAHPDLTESPCGTYTKWAIENQDIMIGKYQEAA